MTTLAGAPRAAAKAVLLAACGVSLAACTAALEATAPSPSNFERFEIGTPRVTVESVLGSPVSQEYNRATYSFSRGSFFAPPETTGLMGRLGRGVLGAFASAASVFVLEPLSGTIAILERKAFVGRITIVYGPDGRVIGRWYEAAEALYVAWKGRRQPEERLDLLCRAANGGYPSAQHAQAVRYELGLFEAPVDLAEAYLWARLAELGGDPRAGTARQRIAASLDAAELAAADARYASWSPAPCPMPEVAPEA
jgi:hypothetical protein